MAYVADITVSVPLTKLVLTSRQKLGGCRNGIGSDATASVLYWQRNVSNPCNSVISGSSRQYNNARGV